ncbi:hypothetical protein [Streptomyces sp. CAU 1734]|uniref:hypothetical protein n=1 Tax=Streptomyces sp. CAU 1734 TaxID=3140360 RepID=UPI00325FF737
MSRDCRSGGHEDTAGQDGRICTALRSLLREVADAEPIGSAPVARVLSRGRAARRRRTAVTAGALAVAALTVLGYAAVPQLQRAGPTTVEAVTVTPVVPSPGPPVIGAGRVRVVQAYETVDLGRGVCMVLAPEGRGTFAAGQGASAKEIDWERSVASGSPGLTGVTGGYSAELGLVRAAFRTARPPARLVVRTRDGREHRTGALRLPGQLWGVYYAFVGPGALADGYAVTAYASDGKVLAKGWFDPSGGPEAAPDRAPDWYWSDI